VHRFGSPCVTGWRCFHRLAARCSRIPIGETRAEVGAIDDATHTLYASGASSISVINTATCNAANTTGCCRPADAQAVGSSPFGLAVDDGINTVYALTGAGPGAASIFEGS
jgi:DNA-binding beta-propeller fold protein YncE